MVLLLLEDHIMIDDAKRGWGVGVDVASEGGWMLHQKTGDEQCKIRIASLVQGTLAQKVKESKSVLQ